MLSRQRNKFSVFSHCLIWDSNMILTTQINCWADNEIKSLLVCTNIFQQQCTEYSSSLSVIYETSSQRFMSYHLWWECFGLFVLIKCFASADCSSYSSFSLVLCEFSWALELERSCEIKAEWRVGWRGPSTENRTPPFNLCNLHDAEK